MNVEMGTVAAQFLFWKYLSRFFCIGSLQCKSSYGRYCIMYISLDTNLDTLDYEAHEVGKDGQQVHHVEGRLEELPLLRGAQESNRVL
jgi:hypothetical protein